MASPHPEKKSETLEIRLPYSKKQAFMRAVRENDETASDAVRGFIDRYVERARRAERKQLIQEMKRAMTRNRKKSLAMIAGCAGAALAFTALPSAADDAIFKAFDKNGDGVLSQDEIGKRDDTVLEILDADRSGDISSDEFEPHAKVVEVSDSVRDDGEQEVRMIELKRTEIRFAEDGESQVSIMRVAENIDLDASDADVDALIEKLERRAEDHRPKPPAQ